MTRLFKTFEVMVSYQIFVFLNFNQKGWRSMKKYSTEENLKCSKFLREPPFPKSLAGTTRESNLCAFN